MRLVTREILSIMEDNSIPLTPAYGIREIERRRNSDMFNSSGVRSVFFFFQASKKIIYIFIKEKKKGSKEKIKKKHGEIESQIVRMYCHSSTEAYVHHVKIQSPTQKINKLRT